MLVPRIEVAPPRREHLGGRRLAVDLLLLTLFIGVAYFARMTELPFVGEEGRRARGAINMIESGDWIVVRQGGIVFPDRPPMTNWLIALGGLARGSVDLVAIRLPSLLAVLATSLLIYLYGIRLETRLTALTAAAAFATFGQVLQLGRLGESEAVFTFFLAAALLLWHLAFSLGRSPTLAFVIGYSLTALAALVKGIQAPIYFVAVTTVFLLLNRNWRWLFGRGQWLGLACFLAIVGAWQLPYYLATDIDTSLASWFDVVGPRLGLSGLLANMVEYPLETFGSLAPWSFLLLALANGTVRKAVAHRHAAFAFILTSLAVTYPSVWFSAGAEGRYYMPLYPSAALLIGMIVEQLVASETGSAGARVRRIMLRFVVGAAVLTAVVTALSWLVERPYIRSARPTAAWTVALVLLSAVTFRAALLADRRPSRSAVARSLLAAAALLGLVHTTLWVNLVNGRRQTIQPLVEAARGLVPNPSELVSLGPADPRFAYPYGDFIAELPWPETLEHLDPEVDYFCFDRRPTDTPERRYVERGMKKWFTPGVLPFEWEEITYVGVGPKAEEPPSVAVVIGRVVRDERGRPKPARR